jgi:hypothetical protein
MRLLLALGVIVAHAADLASLVRLAIESFKGSKTSIAPKIQQLPCRETDSRQRAMSYDGPFREVVSGLDAVRESASRSFLTRVWSTKIRDSGETRE